MQADVRGERRRSRKLSGAQDVGRRLHTKATRAPTTSPTSAPMSVAGPASIDAGLVVVAAFMGGDAVAADGPGRTVTLVVEPGSFPGKFRTQIVHVPALGSDTVPRQSVESDGSRASCTATSASPSCWATTSNG